MTVAPTAPIKGAGSPHIVLEVAQAADAVRTWETGDPRSNSYGRKNEVRVAQIVDDIIMRHWVEAIDLIPYEPA